ncbi:hypothetical protein PR048_024630 [Dryococelus australis]|uniref:Uncharacterized protein n=1 Tax=Dryococelus australis TaxID=614101 RepID=A0ABQ9GP38_9NEOP|nr:hypothetical protein PR048_024630 [Dryococelus australis]
MPWGMQAGRTGQVCLRAASYVMPLLLAPQTPRLNGPSCVNLPFYRPWVEATDGKTGECWLGILIKDVTGCFLRTTWGYIYYRYVRILHGKQVLQVLSARNEDCCKQSLKGRRLVRSEQRVLEMKTVLKIRALSPFILIRATAATKFGEGWSQSEGETSPVHCYRSSTIYIPYLPPTAVKVSGRNIGVCELVGSKVHSTTRQEGIRDTPASSHAASVGCCSADTVSVQPFFTSESSAIRHDQGKALTSCSFIPTRFCYHMKRQHNQGKANLIIISNLQYGQCELHRKWQQNCCVTDLVTIVVFKAILLCVADNYVNPDQDNIWWTRPWIRRRDKGISNIHSLLNNELRSEDPECFKNYLQTDEKPNETQMIKSVFYSHMFSLENQPTSGIVRHDSHMRKSGGDPAGDRIQFALMGGKQANRSATAAQTSLLLVPFASTCRLRLHNPANSQLSETVGLEAHHSLNSFVLSDLVHGKTSSNHSIGRKLKLRERDRRALKRIVTSNKNTTTTKVTAELIMHKRWNGMVDEVRVPKKTLQPRAISPVFPIYENPGVTPQEINLGSSWWKANDFTTTPPTIEKLNHRDCDMHVCIVLTVKFSRDGVAVSGCFSWKALGPFIILWGMLNVEDPYGLISPQYDAEGCLESLVQQQSQNALRPQGGDCLAAAKLRKLLGSPLHHPLAQRELDPSSETTVRALNVYVCFSVTGIRLVEELFLQWEIRERSRRRKPIRNRTAMNHPTDWREPCGLPHPGVERGLSDHEDGQKCTKEKSSNCGHVALHVSPPLPLEGSLASNTRLNNAEHLFEGEIKGPESFAVLKGVLYTGLHGGHVVKVLQDKIVPIAKFGRDC